MYVYNLLSLVKNSHLQNKYKPRGTVDNNYIPMTHQGKKTKPADFITESPCNMLVAQLFLSLGEA